MELITGGKPTLPKQNVVIWDSYGGELYVVNVDPLANDGKERKSNSWEKQYPKKVTLDQRVVQQHPWTHTKG